MFPECTTIGESFIILIFGGIIGCIVGFYFGKNIKEGGTKVIKT